MNKKLFLSTVSSEFAEYRKLLTCLGLGSSHIGRLWLRVGLCIFGGY